MNASENHPVIDAVVLNEPPSPEASRPVGAVLLGVVLLAAGLIVFGTRCNLLFDAFTSSDQVVVPAGYLGIVATEMTLALTGAIGGFGLIVGYRFGWWLSLVNLTWRTASKGIWPSLFYAMGAGGDPQTQPMFLQQAVIHGAICCLLAVYLHKRNVKSYFGSTSNPVIAIPLLTVAFVVIGPIFGYALTAGFKILGL